MRVVRRVVHIDSFEQHLDLSGRERHGAGAVLDCGSFRNRERALLQSL